MSDAVQKPRSVNIKVPEQYDQVDESVWSDLEIYLCQGFLTTQAHFVGKTFVFKTLNHHEFRYVQMLRPMKASSPEVRSVFQSNFIAHSIFLIDGENTLVNRSKHIVRLSKIVQRLDMSLQMKILENLEALNKKASRLYPLTEVYIHENRSRFRWLHSQHSPIHSTLNTGIQGSEELGMNYCQQTWTALSKLLDDRERIERDWTNAKFIGSCFAGKGVRSIDERDKARRERERSELEDLKMKVLYSYLNRLAPDEVPQEQITLPDGRLAVVEKRSRAVSVDELADQLSAALSGEKDHHDTIVEAHLKKSVERNKAQEENNNRMFRLPSISSTLGDQQTSAGAIILGGKKEADEIISRSKAMQEERIRRIKSEDIENSDKKIQIRPPKS